MKKVLFSLFFVLVSIFIFSAVTVKATDTGVVTITNSASVRTQDPAGLKFEATISGNFEGSEFEYGFVLTKGTFTKQEVIDLANEKKVEVDCGEPDGEGKYNVTITNIPEEGYTGNVTALAYVKVDGVNRYSDITVTRNIAEVARAAYNGSTTYDEGVNLVKTIANASRIKVTHSNSSVNYYDEFSSFSFTAGDTIELIKGTYSENFTIGVNNVTINGVNSGIHYDGVRSSNESIITGNIAISKNTTHLTLDGLKFSGTAKITNSAGTAGAADAATSNIDNFTFRNNIVETELASGNGFIYFVEAGSSYSNDLTFEYNWLDRKSVV